MTRGTFCISIDTELLWGRWDKDYRPFIEKTKKERGVIKRLLSLFGNYNVPVTWAIVGKLLSPPEKGKEPQLWYGQDLVQMIRKYQNHELASHSFSHITFDNCSKKEAEEDIRASVAAARPYGIKFESFVFPRNRVGHLNVLKKYDFKSFRGPDKRSWELVAPGVPPVYQPQIINGLVNIPGSMYLVSARGARKYIPHNIRVIKAKLGINNAIRNKKVFHFWFHPVDLVDNEDGMFWTLEQIIDFAKQRQKGGKLEIKTMAQIAKEVLS